MSPARSIRAELGEAVVGGIRERGPDAVGMILIGLARLLIGTAALTVLLAASAISGYDLSALQFAGLSVTAVLLNAVLSPRHR